MLLFMQEQNRLKAIHSIYTRCFSLQNGMVIIIRIRTSAVWGFSDAFQQNNGVSHVYYSSDMTHLDTNYVSECVDPKKKGEVIYTALAYLKGAIYDQRGKLPMG
jgi:hypothetical protein